MICLVIDADFTCVNYEQNCRSEEFRANGSVHIADVLVFFTSLEQRPEPWVELEVKVGYDKKSLLEEISSYFCPWNL